MQSALPWRAATQPSQQVVELSWRAERAEPAAICCFNEDEAGATEQPPVAVLVAVEAQRLRAICMLQQARIVRGLA